MHLAKSAGLAIGPDGGITTNRYMQTSDPDVYAVGDAVQYSFGPTEGPMRVALAGPANRAGRLAGEHAATDAAHPMADVFATSIVRVFEQSAAQTGLSTARARQLGISARSVTVVANHHAGYYPGATPITLKLVFDPKYGRVLGAQAVGRDGVDKRIDVIATAMSLGATVWDLAGLDLTYAPPSARPRIPSTWRPSRPAISWTESPTSWMRMRISAACRSSTCGRPRRCSGCRFRARITR